MRTLLILSLLFHVKAWADTSFENHVLYTSQAMSALYMYELSNANPEYLLIFNEKTNAAKLAIKDCPNHLQKLFINRWYALLPHWKFKNIRGRQDLYLDSVVRNNARNYLTDIFLHLQTIPVTTNNSQRKFTDIKIYTAILSARALDILSAHEGSAALSNHDKKINAKSLSSTVHANIKNLMSKQYSKSQHKNLKKVLGQFEFISRYIIEYDHKMPYLLLYKSVLNMEKRLSSHHQILVSN